MVVVDFVDIIAVSGVVDVIRWYRKGTPVAARVNGESMESVDCAYDHPSS